MKKKAVIDLGAYTEPVQRFVANTVSNFQKDHPDVEVSMLCLGYAGLNPGLMVAFDTTAHSTADVQQCGDQSSYYGEDRFGRYCNNPWSCEFQVGEYRFDGFPDLYEVNPRLKIKHLDGTTSSLDLGEVGDEGMNELMFGFLLAVFAPFKGYESLRRSPVFRVGIRAANSNCRRFWCTSDPQTSLVVVAGATASLSARESDRLRRVLVAPEWDDNREVLTWVEDRGEDQDPEVMVWQPATEAERDEANRFFEAANRDAGDEQRGRTSR